VDGCRPATESDVPRLAELAREVMAELTPMRGGAVWRAREARTEPLAENLAALLHDPHHRVVVGTIDGVVMGYAVGRLERLNDGSTLGVIDDIFVEEGARGIGIGEAMINDVIAWCQSAGCVGIDAMALPGHRLTKNFFEESGFSARQLVMHRPLHEEPRAEP
jgi:GNAT superfamily N-acetyltransferase